jgi:hypothetical protein
LPHISLPSRATARSSGSRATTRSTQQTITGGREPRSTSRTGFGIRSWCIRRVSGQGERAGRRGARRAPRDR